MEMVQTNSQTLMPADYRIVVLACLVSIILVLRRRAGTKAYINVPSVGLGARLGLFVGSLQFILNARGVLQHGYFKYNRRTFKVPESGRWRVVVNDRSLIDEILRTPDDKMSFMESAMETIAADYTIGPLTGMTEDHYFIRVIRNNLTRNMAELFPTLMDEISTSIEDLIPCSDSDWRALPASETVTRVFCRVINRLLVGVPLCRNKAYIDLMANFTIDVMAAANIINAFPNVLRRPVGKMMTTVSKNTQRAVEFLRPTIEYRLSNYEEHGKDWAAKPNDMLSWLMDEGSDLQRSTESLTQCILAVNFSAVHTSAMTFTHALFHLAAFPKLAEGLREELLHVIKDDGWTKSGMARLKKLDSFFKESQRFYGIGMLTAPRKVLENHTLSDGTFLPAGSVLACNAASVHRDEKHYANAQVFDAERFLDSSCRKDSSVQQFTATSLTYLSWGHGKHSCPGRFFAASELKAIMAYLLFHFDIALEHEGNVPRPFEFGASIIPNQKARVLFKRRSLSS